jgi:membrane associated rhomboid family serine protease
MTGIVANCYRSLRPGIRLFVLCWVLGYPAFKIGLWTNTFNLLYWTGLSPALIWKGQAWRLITYALWGGGVGFWLIETFWLLTFGAVLGRNWSSATFWSFSLVTALAGALPIVLFWPQQNFLLQGNGAIAFAQIVAWGKIYGNERIVLLGFGEMSVRQAAIVLAIISAILAFFSCGGWLSTPCLAGGGLAGWLYVLIGNRRTLARPSQVVESERIARLEL